MQVFAKGAVVLCRDRNLTASQVECILRVVVFFSFQVQGGSNDF